MFMRGFPGFALIAGLSATLLCGALLSTANAQVPPAPPAANAAASPQDDAVPQNVKDAVARALAYCKTQQKPDGSFTSGPGAGDSAVPSLVVMAYLAHGDVPGQGPYGDVINKAIDYVLDSQRPDGILSHNPPGNVMYEHAVSTVMLSEVYGMVDDTRRAKIDTALSKSVAVILAAQKVPKSPVFQGGWRYQPGSADSDLSVTGWQLMALRGAAECGAAVPPAAISAGVDYDRRSAVPTGGFSYQPGGGPDQACTGTGIVAMELLGQHNSPQAIAGGNWLLANPPSQPNIAFYFYAIYYCAQAANQLGALDRTLSPAGQVPAHPPAPRRQLLRPRPRCPSRPLLLQRDVLPGPVRAVPISAAVSEVTKLPNSQLHTGSS
jgi:hypothetical protein